MKEIANLNHCFLVAMPSLNDANFARSVIFIFDQGAEGTTGLIVNKKLPINLGNVLEHLEIDCNDAIAASQPVLMGGPIGQDNGFIIHTEPNTSRVDICITTSKNKLSEIATGHCPDKYVVALGYSGWRPGQLEAEIAANDWLVVPYNETLLFNAPIDTRWEAAGRLVGIEMSQLSDKVGHA